MIIESTNSPWRYWRRLNRFSRRSAMLPSIGWISSMTVACAQNTRTIRGTVVDQDQNPVENANVAVVGSNIVVSTDVNGAFTVEQLSPSATKLVISKT